MYTKLLVFNIVILSFFSCAEENQNLDIKFWNYYTNKIGLNLGTKQRIYLITVPTSCSTCNDELQYIMNETDETDISLIVKTKSKDLFNLYKSRIDREIEVYQDSTSILDSTIFTDTYYLRVFLDGNNHIYYNNGLNKKSLDEIIEFTKKY